MRDERDCACGVQHLDALMRLVQEVLEKRMEQEVFIASGRIFELVTTGREGVLGMLAGAEGHEFPLAPKYRVLLSSIIERLLERLKFSFAQYYILPPTPGSVFSPSPFPFPLPPAPSPYFLFLFILLVLAHS